MANSQLTDTILQSLAIAQQLNSEHLVMVTVVSDGDSGE